MRGPKVDDFNDDDFNDAAQQGPGGITQRD
jgi:hypothetical protein